VEITSPRAPVRRVAAVAAVLAAAVAVAGCASSAGPAGAGSPGFSSAVAVVAAENEYGDVAAQIGGPYVHVVSVVSNPNTDPHTYEVSPSVALEVSSAALVIENGLGYDSFMGKLESASPSSKRKTVDVQRLLALPDSTPDPHLWYDPRTMPTVARAVADDLAAIDPAHAGAFRANLAKFDAALQPWIQAIASFKAKYNGTPGATTEPVADYLLEAMGIDNLTPFRFQAAVMNGTDPAPEDIARENSYLSGHRVKLFAYNEQVVDSLTESIRSDARKAGVPVVAVYETMPTPGYDYQSWMLAETEALRSAVTAGTSTEHL
jgi:zinc/manganese transport system substrate-binding protein